MPVGRSYSDPSLRRFLTGRELMLYDEGYEQGFRDASPSREYRTPEERASPRMAPRKKRKLSAWNKFVKANSKKPRFIYRNGKLNLKKMGVAFRKTPAGKKGRKR